MAADLTEDTRVIRLEEVVSCELAGGAALLDLRSSMYYSLNGAGSAIWELMEGPVAVAELRDAIVQRYDVEPERCLADVLALLNQFNKAGLIKVVDETAG